MKIVALTDSANPWHSYWIRIGQYIENITIESITTDNLSEVQSLRKDDVLILYRYNINWGAMNNILQSLSKKGVFIISDIDDCLWQANNWSKERLTGLNQNLKNSHLITCSTMALKELLNVMYPKKKTILIQNSTPIRRSNAKDNIHDCVRLCWTGAPWTRPEDLRLLIPLANWIRVNSVRVKWLHIGHVEGQASFAEIIGIEKDSVETVPLMGYKDYLKVIQGEIGLAPLSKGGFNGFKSELKILEYSGLGIPWIASDSRPYSELCSRWGIKGRLCKTGDDWISNLQELLHRTIRLREGNILEKKSHTLQGYNLSLAKWTTLVTSAKSLYS